MTPSAGNSAPIVTLIRLRKDVRKKLENKAKAEQRSISAQAAVIIEEALQGSTRRAS